MQASSLIQIVMPLAIIMLMFGLGIGLKVADFSRLFAMPRPVIAGVIGQVLILPLIALLVLSFSSLSPVFAVGIMLIAVCPGGTTSNIFSQLSRANVALSVTLTGFTSIISVFTMPLIVSSSLKHFGLDGVNFSVLNTTLGMFAVSVLPVLAGIYVNHKWHERAVKAEPVFRKLSLVVLMLFFVALYMKDGEIIKANFSGLALLTFLLNVISMAAGVLLAYLFKVSAVDRLTLGIEVGIQNSGLALLIAANFLGDMQFAIPALVYTVTMYFGVTCFIFTHKKLRKKTEEKDAIAIECE